MIPNGERWDLWEPDGIEEEIIIEEDEDDE